MNLHAGRGWRALLSAVERESDPFVLDATWAEVMHRVRGLARLVVAAYGSPPVIDAEDLTQDVLVKLQRPEVVRAVMAATSPDNYLTILARNAVRDAARRKARERAALQRRLQPVPVSESDPIDLVALADLLVALTTDERRLLYLRFWSGLSIEEICEAMNLRYSTVSVRIFRLLARLRAQLA